MPRLSSLPEELRYLEPFRKQVAKLKPEEIDESMDLSRLNKLLLKCIEGIPVAAGKNKLEEDSVNLERWLATPGINDNGGMTFLHGYLMALPELVDRLIAEKNKSCEMDEVEMELPPEAKVKKRLGGGGGWQVNWLRANFFVFPTFQNFFNSPFSNWRRGNR
jgi:hypothetical protein